MQITFILPGTEMHGGIKSTFEIANRLIERGNQVRIVYPIIPIRNGASRFSARRYASRVLGLIANIKSGNAVKWFDVRAELVRVPTLNERFIPPADIIVATWWANAYDVSNYAGDKGRKFYFIRAYETFGGPPDKVEGSYALPMTRLTVSTWLKEFIEDRFCVPTLGPFPNAIDFDTFRSQRADFGAHDPLRVGMLYRRIPLTGMSEGFDAFKKVRRRFPGTRLVLFGDEPSNSDWQKIRQLGAVEHHLLPHGRALAEIYNSLDIFVFPSHIEGFGNPPMEAMACGAACIATRVGGVPDYSIPGRTAMVVPPRDVGELTGALMELAANEQLRRKIAVAGHEHVQSLTWDKTVERLDRLFMETVGDRDARTSPYRSGS